MKENNTYRNHTGGSPLPQSLRVNPFTLPDNYFEELEKKTLWAIQFSSKEDETGGFIVPSDFFKEQGEQIQKQAAIDAGFGEINFTVPESYFLNSADQLIAQTKLDRVGTPTPDLPSDYFDKLSARIIHRVEREKSVGFTPRSISRIEDGFTVPSGYFDTTADEILSTIGNEELKAKVETDGFAVPEGYFQSLNQDILEHVFEEDKVIPFIPEPLQAVRRKKQDKTKIFTWLGSSAAACAAVFIGINFYQQEASQRVQFDETMTLRDIPEEEIINYLSNNSDPSDLDYYVEYIYQPEESKGIGSGIDAKDLEEYLNYTL